MLPHIHSEKWDGAFVRSNDWVLIVRRYNLETSSLLISRTLCSGNEPPPATALDTEKGLFEVINEIVKAAPFGLDSGFHSRGHGIDVGVCGGYGGKVAPEERVVDVASAVEFDFLLQGKQCGDVAAGGGGLMCREGSVEIVDVCLVVFLMVEGHYLGGYDGLESLSQSLALAEVARVACRVE